MLSVLDSEYLFIIFIFKYHLYLSKEKKEIWGEKIKMELGEPDESGRMHPIPRFLETTSRYNTWMIKTKKEEESIKFFIDFNKSDNILYDNLYIGDYKIVIRFPICNKDNLPSQIKIEKFSLINHIFLASY